MTVMGFGSTAVNDIHSTVLLEGRVYYVAPTVGASIFASENKVPSAIMLCAEGDGVDAEVAIWLT